MKESCPSDSTKTIPRFPVDWALAINTKGIEYLSTASRNINLACTGRDTELSYGMRYTLKGRLIFFILNYRDPRLFSF